MRSSFSVIAAMLVAVAALSSAFVLWRTLEARDRVIEQALASGKQRELELAKSAQALSDANAKLTEALARSQAVVGGGKTASDLAERLTTVENTLAASPAFNAEKVARDLGALRRDTQEAFNQVGIAIAELKQQAAKSSAK